MAVLKEDDRYPDDDRHVTDLVLLITEHTRFNMIVVAIKKIYRN